MPHSILSPTPRTGPKKGDIDDDGNINAIDFALFRMFLLGKLEMPFRQFFEYRADLNRDLRIDSIDFAILQKCLLGIIDRYTL